MIEMEVESGHLEEVVDMEAGVILMIIYGCASDHLDQVVVGVEVNRVVVKGVWLRGLVVGLYSLVLATLGELLGAAGEQILWMEEDRG